MTTRLNKKNKKDLKNVLVLDIKTTCWNNKTPSGQLSEIIKVGICTLNLNEGKVLTKEHFLIKPEHSKVSEFCTKVTGLTQEEVDQGIKFENICEVLQNTYNSKNRVWASYGSYGRTLFQRQCRLKQIPYPFSSTHYNIKNLLALKIKLNSEVKFDKGLEMLGLKYIGEKNIGANDAWNMSNLFRYLLEQEIILK